MPQQVRRCTPNVAVYLSLQKEISLLWGSRWGSRTLTLAIAAPVASVIAGMYQWGRETQTFPTETAGKSQRLEEKSYLRYLLSHLS